MKHRVWMKRSVDETSFDELITTGAAVRRAVDKEGYLRKAVMVTLRPRQTGFAIKGPRML